MKKSGLLIILVLVFANPIYADVVEIFDVGSPFQLGIPGPNPGTQISIDNSFQTSPMTGTIQARNPRSILAGGGNVAFTAFATGMTEIHFDMGEGIAVSTLPDAMLTGSQILMTGIESDADASNFSFTFTAQFVDGSQVANMADLGVTSTLGTITLTDLDGGLFQAELTGNSGTSEVAITTISGGILRAVQFRSIVPDFETDELVVIGSRSLFTTVPEPGSVIVLSFVGVLIGMRRRKTS